MTREEAIEILVTCVVRPDPDSDGGYWTPLQAFPVGSAGEQAIRLLKDSRHRAHAVEPSKRDVIAAVAPAYGFERTGTNAWVWECPSGKCAAWVYDQDMENEGYLKIHERFRDARPDCTCKAEVQGAIDETEDRIEQEMEISHFYKIATERGYCRDAEAGLWRRGGHTVFDSSVGVERAEDVFDELPKSTSVDEGVNSSALSISTHCAQCGEKMAYGPWVNDHCKCPHPPTLEYVGTFSGVVIKRDNRSSRTTAINEEWLRSARKYPFATSWNLCDEEIAELLSWVIPDPGTEVPEETAKVLRARGLRPVPNSRNGVEWIDLTGYVDVHTGDRALHRAKGSAEAARNTLDSVVQSAKPCNCEDGWVMLAYSREPCPNGCVPGKTKGW